MSLFLNGAAPGQDELRYRATMTFRGNREPEVAEFLLTPTPVVRTRNRMKKPRMGGWRLASIRRKGEPPAGPELLARLERLLYFSGPAPSLVQKPIFIQYGRKECQVWQVPTPPGLDAVVYLVQAAPGILALSSFRGRFAAGELESLDLRLQDFRLRSKVAPAENGMVLLTTLARLSHIQQAPDPSDEAAEVVE